MKSIKADPIIHTVDITEDDIKGGVPKSCNRCPVARAVKRVFNLNDEYATIYIEHEHAHVYLEEGHKHKVFTLPFEVVLFIQDFDAGNKVNPLSFTIEVSP